MMKNKRLKNQWLCVRRSTSQLEGDPTVGIARPFLKIAKKLKVGLELSNNALRCLQNFEMMTLKRFLRPTNINKKIH